MKRLLIPFLALALCPLAQAWEQFHPHKGYQYCVEHILRGWNRQKRGVELLELRRQAHEQS